MAGSLGAMAPVILIFVLVVVFVVVAAAFAWQEKKSAAESVTIYSVEESIAYVVDRLSPEAAGNLRRSDVRRILEWELRYLQDPAVRRAGPIIAGGLPSAEYAQQTLAALGHPYDGPDIIEVLDLRAEYLAEIGAIGEPLSAVEVAALDSEADEAGAT